MIRRPPRSTLFPYTTLFRSRPVAPVLARARFVLAEIEADLARLEPHIGTLHQVVGPAPGFRIRSEEHTSELQSRLHLVCRLLLEKKKNKRNTASVYTTIHRP